MKLAALISGSGRTVVNLAEHIERGALDARLVVVVSSRPGVAGLDRARERGLPTVVVPRKGHPDAAAFSDAVWSALRPHAPDLVCMAGFLSLLHIPADYEGRVLNIHPSLLPAFGGAGMYGHRVHEAVIASGVAVSGCTVHLADNEYDKGTILVQRTVPVLPTDTPDALAARVFEQECIAYPEAIRRVMAARRG